MMLRRIRPHHALLAGAGSWVGDKLLDSFRRGLCRVLAFLAGWGQCRRRIRSSALHNDELTEEQ